VIHSNRAPIAYAVAVINCEDGKFFIPRAFNARAKRFPLKFRNDDGLKKPRRMPLLEWQKVCPDVHSFKHNTGIRQTDGRTD